MNINETPKDPKPRCDNCDCDLTERPFVPVNPRFAGRKFCCERCCEDFIQDQWEWDSYHV